MPFLRYACGVKWHCVRWGCLTPKGMGDLGSNPQPKHTIANCSQPVSPYAVTWRIQRKVSDSAFCRITLVFLFRFLSSVVSANTPPSGIIRPLLTAVSPTAYVTWLYSYYNHHRRLDNVSNIETRLRLFTTIVFTIAYKPLSKCVIIKVREEVFSCSGEV